jgi:hypothetical protein
MNRVDDIAWLTPWQQAQAAGLAVELQKEVGTAHPLYQQQAIAIGQRCDCDDVLFHLPASSVPYAMVHLTWSGKTEPLGRPATSLYTSLEDWIKQCMQPDHETYRGEA